MTEIKWSSVLGGAIIGVLVGLLICYYKQLQSAYANRDVLSSGANLVSAGEQFYTTVRAKL
jgi:hypothetical protein